MRSTSGTSGAVAVAAALLLGLAPSAQAGTFTVSKRSDIAELEARVRATQFLGRATFGATKADVDSLAQRVLALGDTAAFEEWIDGQFELPATYHHPLAVQMITDDGYGFEDAGLRSTNYKHYAWWHSAIAAPDQLRQRMAWALAQIFVVNQNGSGFNSKRLDLSGKPQYLGLADYYDTLIAHSFGYYGDLLYDVTLHPIMGVFLSHVRNPKGNPTLGTYPDENYAREVMQLLTIGLYELKKNGDINTDRFGNPIAAYDNDDVRELARVFTGLGYAGAPSFNSGQQNLHEPMVMWQDYHDTGSKTLLGGTVLPADQPGLKDISDALDNLASDPNTGPFVARLSDPAPGQVQPHDQLHRSGRHGVQGQRKRRIRRLPSGAQGDPSSSRGAGRRELLHGAQAPRTANRRGRHRGLQAP
jgi:uncharacterized protein (DUF1800 family)